MASIDEHLDIYTLLEEKEEHLGKSKVNIYDLLTKRSDFLKHKPRKWKGLIFKKIDFIEVTQIDKEGEQYILKNPKFDTIYKLNQSSLFLWERMDGEHTVRDLLLAYYNEFGSFAYDKIVGLIMDLRKNMMLTEDYINIYEKLNIWVQAKALTYKVFSFFKKLFTLEWSLKDSDRLFNKLYRYGGKIFIQPVVLIPLLSISLCGFFIFAYFFATRSFTLFSESELFGITIFIFWIINTLVTLTHELAHGLTCTHFGCEVKHGGMQMYYGFPVAFVDTTDIWMASTRARILTSLAGPINDIIWAGLASILLLFVTDPIAQIVIFQFAFINFVSAIFNLNPLWELDGYYILMDIVGVPALRKKSFAFLKRESKHFFLSFRTWNKLEWWFFGYGFLSVLWLGIVFKLLYAFYAGQILWIIHAIQDNSISLTLIIGTLVALLFVIPLSLKGLEVAFHRKCTT